MDLSGLRHTVEEINNPGLQRILGAHDEEPFFLDSRLENFRSVSKLVCGGADRANGVPHKKPGRRGR